MIKYIWVEVIRDNLIFLFFSGCGRRFWSFFFWFVIGCNCVRIVKMYKVLLGDEIYEKCEELLIRVWNML